MMKPFDEEQVVSLARNGMKYKDIAKELGLSESFVFGILGANGFHRYARQERRLTVSRLHEAGCSVSEIAKEVGLSTDHVKTLIKQMTR